MPMIPREEGKYMTHNSKPRRLGSTMLLVFRVLFSLCLLGTAVFIFFNSAQAGNISGERSTDVTALLNKIPAGLGMSFRCSELLVRKLAHFAEYALLGFWLMLTLRVYTRRIISCIAWPLFFGLLTAVADEFFQLFIPGRAGQVKDVVIDFGGVLSGLCLGLFSILLASAIWDAFHGKR